MSLLLFGAQAAVSHTHVSAHHESQLCAGHLTDPGAGDLEHSATCLLCSASKRGRDLQRRRATLPTSPVSVAVPVAVSETQTLPTLDARDAVAPRAPPALPAR